MTQWSRAPSAMFDVGTVLLESYLFGFSGDQANIMTVSADAKTRTFTAVGVDASGKPLNNVTVFRQAVAAIHMPAMAHRPGLLPNQKSGLFATGM